VSLSKVKSSVSDKPGCLPLVRNGGAIEFKNVQFGFDTERQILKGMNSLFLRGVSFILLSSLMTPANQGIMQTRHSQKPTTPPIFLDMSFKVPAGSTVAIVGSSGCGKSTLLRLLYRFYDVDKGQVLVDGQDVRDVSLDSLRRMIGVVPQVLEHSIEMLCFRRMHMLNVYSYFCAVCSWLSLAEKSKSPNTQSQDTMMFNESIYYNIAYGNTNATEEEVYKAAKLARVHDAIMGMPQQYATPVFRSLIFGDRVVDEHVSQYLISSMCTHLKVIVLLVDICKHQKQILYALYHIGGRART
jgi:ABC-type transport system involved in Fe-S cluster assembly fused permease/ATPase subunit